MTEKIFATDPLRTSTPLAAEVALHCRNARGSEPVKPRWLYRVGVQGLVAFTIALATALPVGALRAQSADDRYTPPAPNVERQIDRLERGGSVDSLTRRRLQDQLRRASPGPERSAAERTLDRLPSEAVSPDAPLPPAPEPDSLPSSLRPGFGSSGGPGVSGYMVPPGGRSGAVR